MQQIWGAIQFYMILSTVTFFIYKLVVTWMFSRMNYQNDAATGAATAPLIDENINDRRVFSKWSLLIDCFYRSFNPLMDFELDENVESLFERLVLPNMWLTPAVPADYLKYLPVWQFNCWSQETSRMESTTAEIEFPASRRSRNYEQPPPDVKWILSTECAICLDKYGTTVDVCGLPCGHQFHHTCIMVWLHGDNHHCPICRWPAYQNKNLSIM